MNPIRLFPPFFVLFIGLLSGCHVRWIPQSTAEYSYRVSDSLRADPAMDSLISPYREKFTRQMNLVIGEAARTLNHTRPVSELGNFLVDAMLAMARHSYGKPVDAAVLNHGGIRITQLPAGPVTTGKVFEAMPFDNLLVLQRIRGDVLQSFLDFIAEKGGWPLAGIEMDIRGGRAVNVRVGGAPLDPSATYILANSDYVANGGDNADMLRSVPRESNGYLVRDAFIDYIKKLTASGKKIKGRNDP